MDINPDSNPMPDPTLKQGVRRQFPFLQFERKWQDHWLENKTFRAANPGEPGSEKPTFYALDMFPYPSGEGLHVGHPEGYTATDIISRYKRMKGFNVLHPIGWDAFGLPAEQFAIKTGAHPQETTEKNIANFRRQIQSLGFSYDWDREINTTSPEYVRWTQWIFSRIYEKGLAYSTEAPVWFCEELGTSLANEEVLQTPEGPRSERGNYPVAKKNLKQWMLRITAYADRLLEDLDTLDWPESLKTQQREWIGRSVGTEVDFRVATTDTIITAFTTRAETLFGANCLVLAPDHPEVYHLTTRDQADAVAEYQHFTCQLDDRARQDASRPKSGVFTGSFCTNPATGKPIPIWIADYVLSSYGTGAILSVPAHDERDRAFSEKYNLPIQQVIEADVMQHSGFMDGMTPEVARATMTAHLEAQGRGRSKVNYKLRDWLFCRQRYWGEPFPIAWKDGEPQLLPDSELPISLPALQDYTPGASGATPLSKAADWVNRPDGSVMETNTMPQWAGSCWYYLRYCDPKQNQAPAGKEAEKYWLGNHGVDLYVGGAEHAVLHLLYARFWHKVLYDIGVVSSPEPFHKLVNQGLILGEDGKKMAKSGGNVINPDEVTQEYGADALRLFEMFMGPLTQVKPWSTKGVEGVYRFLGRVWRSHMEEGADGQWTLSSKVTHNPPSEELTRSLHQTIAKVTEAIEGMQFNVGIAALMSLTNDLTKADQKPRAILEPLALLLAPFAPHMAEELWQQLGHPQSLAYEPWPVADLKYLTVDQTELGVQVNGKVQGRFVMPAAATQEEVEAALRAHPELDVWTGGKPIKKVIVVKGRLVSVVCQQ